MIYNKNNKQYLEEIKNGTSKLFPVIPNEIGNVVYCATDKLEISKSVKELKLSKAIRLVVTILIVTVIVGFLSLSGILLLPIITGVIGLVIIVFMALQKAKFKGYNEILGTEGYVMQWFEDSRDNITTSRIYKFSDMYDIIVESSYNLINGVFYAGSERNYHFWSIADRKSKWPTFDRKIYYDKNSTWDDFDLVPINYEEQWTNYRLNILMPAFDNNEFVWFNYFKGMVTYEIFDKYIGISKDSLYIDGKICNKENIKDIRLKNGALIIKTNQDYISLEVGGIGSFKAFHTLLLELAKNNLSTVFFAALGGDVESVLKDALGL